jgi:hypothetical protein
MLGYSRRKCQRANEMRLPTCLVKSQAVAPR